MVVEMKKIENGFKIDQKISAEKFFRLLDESPSKIEISKSVLNQSKTIRLILETIQMTQSWERAPDIVVTEKGGATRFVFVKSGTPKMGGLLSLPEDEQTRVIRKHFPEPSAEEISLVKLFLAGSTTKNKPLKISPPPTVVERGWMKPVRGGYYLTEDGANIARGVLKTYPELRSAPRLR